MTTVTENVDLPASVEPTRTVVDVRLVGTDGVPLSEAYDTAAAKTIVGRHVVQLDATGSWSLTLAANSALAPSGTAWARSLHGPGLNLPPSYATVPASGTYRWDQILTSAPAAVADSALGAHKASPLASAHHGVVDHIWATVGTTGWNKRVMTADGSQSFSLSVASNRGRFTANSQTNGNHREVWYRDGTSWADSRVTSLIAAPEVFVGGDLAQWGHLHRLQPHPTTPGLWRAFAVWTDIVFGAPWVLNMTVVTFDGTTLTSGSETLQPNVQDRVDRTLLALRAQRTSNVVTVQSAEPWLPQVGDVGTLAGMAAAGFNATSVTVTAASTADRSFSFAQVAANATDADAGGRWTPADRVRTTPYMLSTMLVGNTLMAKQWRPEQPQPDWGDPNKVSSITFSGGTLPPHSGVGDCALWVAHINESHWLAYGDVRLEKLG